MVASVSDQHNDDARVSNSVPDGAWSAKGTMNGGGAEPARIGASGMRILFLSLFNITFNIIHDSFSFANIQIVVVQQA